MTTTRAKFRCNSVTLVRTMRNKPGVEYKNGKYVDQEGNEVPSGEQWMDFDQPTVVLNPVTGGSPENKTFFAASPAGELKLTIDNPAGAEIFELGKEYYVDFTPAD